MGLTGADWDLGVAGPVAVWADLFALVGEHIVDLDFRMSPLKLSRTESRTSLMSREEVVDAEDEDDAGSAFERVRFFARLALSFCRACCRFTTPLIVAGRKEQLIIMKYTS
jgi:hypothetical protein